MARSFIGTAAGAEDVELEFNIGTEEAIEIGSVHGIINADVLTSAATIAPQQATQRLHLEDGTIEGISIDSSAADAFDRDSEIIFEQSLNHIAFDGTTEGAAVLDGTHKSMVYRNSILSAINPTHAVANVGSVSESGFVLLIEWRMVKLGTRELALEFTRRRR
jgi:hypothetical protein